MRRRGHWNAEKNQSKTKTCKSKVKLDFRSSGWKEKAENFVGCLSEREWTRPCIANYRKATLAVLQSFYSFECKQPSSLPSPYGTTRTVVSVKVYVLCIWTALFRLLSAVGERQPGKISFERQKWILMARVGVRQQCCTIHEPRSTLKCNCTFGFMRLPHFFAWQDSCSRRCAYFMSQAERKSSSCLSILN